MDILYLSPADWSGPRGRFQHVAVRLARGNRVMYADGLGVRPIGRSDWRRAASKVSRSMRLQADRPVDAPSIHRITPLALPARRLRAVKPLNRALLRSFILAHMKRAGFVRPLIWIAYPHPDLVDVLDYLDPFAVVYDCVDEWSGFERGYDDLSAAEERLATRADLVFTTAAPLQKKIERWNPCCFLVPNGVEVEFFAPAARELPDDVAAIPAPRIGFVGNIAEWVDVELVSEISDARPDWQLIFVGDYLSDRPRPRETNIHWLGYRPYDCIPDYVAAFDICIIPFRDDELTRAVDPLKLYEYLAAGKPVVSTPLPSAMEFSDVISVARGADAFVSAIERALAAGDDQGARLAAARSHDWNGRVAAMADAIRRCLEVDLTQ